MKKSLLFLTAFLMFTLGFSKEGINGNIALGSSVLDYNSEKLNFGNLYLMADITGENKNLTASGKIYYRISLTDDSKDLDKQESLSQKLDIKKAYLKVRPFENPDLFEFAIGKLYSYYLPGNFFSLAETYSGSSRWGKTGLSVKFQSKASMLGLTLPLSETSFEFKNVFALNGAFLYDFSKTTKNLPLSFGLTMLYNYSNTEKEGVNPDVSKNLSFCISLNQQKPIQLANFSYSCCLSYNWHSEVFVASSTFKNVSNYANKDLAYCNFISLNQKFKIYNLSFTVESEAGKSHEGSMLPLYTGFQVQIPLGENFSLRPRFFYYAAFDTNNSENSRQTFEIYPKIYFTKSNFTFSTGFDYTYKQVEENQWKSYWQIPLYLERKF